MSASARRCYNEGHWHAGHSYTMAVFLLIIDDNPGSLELLSTALAQPGLEVLTASDPEEGLDLVREKRRPQIVLTDLVMPRFELASKCWSRLWSSIRRSTWTLMTTAHYSTESAVEAIKKGATDYLNKPISIATKLRERVGKLIERSEAPPACRCGWRMSCWPAPNSRGLSGVVH